MVTICIDNIKILGLLGVFILSGCHYAQASMPSTRASKPAMIVTANTLSESKVSGADYINDGVDHPSVPAPDTKKPVTFQQAASYILTHSDKLLAAQAGWKASHLQAEALEHLRWPVVNLGGMAGRYHISRDVSTDALRERLQEYGNDLSQLAQQFPELAPILSSLQRAGSAGIAEAPSEINVSRYDNFSHANITAALPLYTGGRIKAIEEYAGSRVDVNGSEIATTEEELLSSLVRRYFQVQLAKHIVDVRKAALKAVKGHDHAAQRMLDIGSISKVERLQAKAVLSDARFQMEKAEDDLRLAQSVLNAFLHTRQLTVSTDLFVSDNQLPSLATFQEKALALHPTLAKIAARVRQAEAMKELSAANRKPSIAAFANHQIGENRDWVVGINAQWTLHSSINRGKMVQAAQARLDQIDALRRQARQDILLLVEKNWRAVSNARKRYHSLAREESLARQVLKLDRAGLKEGLNTVIEVNDAHAKLVKSRTQRFNASYEYVVALADLFASTGNIHAFFDYIPTSAIQNNQAEQ
ncbi:MAG: hypothetical protein CSB48_02070 [Proteobacteria bacterium]|nr:MAG: hypothetical protein CSB48_02070 [Pseudomonadota bacterium]PIE40533.1 MAG: hypothetical protein CSA51_00245 [Gammaproteobacteria bacterium]